MKNKKVKISVVATAVALSMTTAVSVGAAVSAQESTGIPNTAMAASSTPTADVVEKTDFNLINPQELLPTIQAMKQEHLLFQAVLMEVQ